MMAALATPITEEWIRERVGLDHENLEDVKSLSLPGTYHEKVTLLGESMRKFTRLKNLDLSRNNISSLLGLESCTLLENLNLYYNDLENLDDLAPLARNPRITHLDLRLNPVSRSEADYRLYLVSILPNLKILDDRSVRDSERESARAHFNLTKPSPTPPTVTQPNNRETSSTSRIVPSGYAQTTMDPDDCAVLNMLAKSEALPPVNTGSSKAVPAMEEYKLNELKSLGAEQVDINTGDNPKLIRNEYDEYYLKKYPNIPIHRMAEMKIDSDEAEKETEAYSTYKGQGHFTANPAVQNGDENSSQSSSQTKSSDQPESTGETNQCPSFIALLDLVDKYWNGSKSLHDNKKFMALAANLLSKVTEESTSVLQQRVSYLRAENQQLKSTGRTADDWNRAKSKLNESDEQLETLKQSIETLREENSKLKIAAYSNNTNGHNGSYTGPSSTSYSTSREQDELKVENSQLKFKLKQMDQMAELARMLQDSHKSLIQTNDHLLRELNELKAPSQRPVSTEPVTAYSLSGSGGRAPVSRPGYSLN